MNNATLLASHKSGFPLHVCCQSCYHSILCSIAAANGFAPAAGCNICHRVPCEGERGICEQRVTLCITVMQHPVCESCHVHSMPVNSMALTRPRGRARAECTKASDTGVLHRHNLSVHPSLLHATSANSIRVCAPYSILPIGYVATGNPH